MSEKAENLMIENLETLVALSREGTMMEASTP